MVWTRAQSSFGSSDHRDKFGGLWQGAFRGARKLGKKSHSDGGEGPGGRGSRSSEYPDTPLSGCAELPAPHSPGNLLEGAQLFDINTGLGDSVASDSPQTVTFGIRSPPGASFQVQHFEAVEDRETEARNRVVSC